MSLALGEIPTDWPDVAALVVVAGLGLYLLVGVLSEAWRDRRR